jgi:GNAT superfamily N-acetyltransferase
MDLVFQRVLASEEDKISKVYDIIKRCGEDMFYNQGLMHWKTPYPKEPIKKNCEEREVFLVRDLDTNQYVHTFQLDFSFPNITKVNKFATIPEFAGKGIGKQSMAYIEAYSRNKHLLKVCLDVYEKNEHAIQFYQNRGFSIIGRMPTKHFMVLLMEKAI